MFPVTNMISWFDYKKHWHIFPIISYKLLFYFKISKYYTFIAQQFTKQYITIVYKSQYIMPKYVFYQHRNCFRVRRKWLKDKNEKLTIQTSCLIGKTLIILRNLWGCSFNQTILPHTLSSLSVDEPLTLATFFPLDQ